MALTINKELRGLVNDYYARVTSVEHNRGRNCLSITVEYFPSQTNAQSQSPSLYWVENYSFPYTTEGVSVSSAYTLLRTLPEFNGAVDN